jgi:hypothetical protein
MPVQHSDSDDMITELVKDASHPDAPDTPPGDKVLRPLVGLVDKACDAFG